MTLSIVAEKMNNQVIGVLVSWPEASRDYILYKCNLHVDSEARG